MHESKENTALPNQENPQVTPPAAPETVPQTEIRKPIYTVTVFDKEGKATLQETEVVPIIRAFPYKNKKPGEFIGKYGDMTYCPSVEQSQTEPQFFRTVADAVRAGFAPCSNCWVNPDLLLGD